MSWEDAERREEMIFAVYGWMLSSVEPEPELGRLGWHYTVGLRENFDTPDLLLWGESDFEGGMAAVRFVAQAVVEHGWDVQEVAAVYDFGLSPVDASQLRWDTLVSWEHRYGRLPGPGELLRLESPADVRWRGRAA